MIRAIDQVRGPGRGLCGVGVSTATWPRERAGTTRHRVRARTRGERGRNPRPPMSPPCPRRHDARARARSEPHSVESRPGPGAPCRADPGSPAPAPSSGARACPQPPTATEAGCPIPPFPSNCSQNSSRRLTSLMPSSPESKKGTGSMAPKPPIRARPHHSTKTQPAQASLKPM